MSIMSRHRLFLLVFYPLNFSVFSLQSKICFFFVFLMFILELKDDKNSEKIVFQVFIFSFITSLINRCACVTEPRLQCSYYVYWPSTMVVMVPTNLWQFFSQERREFYQRLTFLPFTNTAIVCISLRLSIDYWLRD